MKTEQNRVFLGYMRKANGMIEAHPLEVPVVNIIYHAYLDGNSLGKISDLLKEMNIPSPSGKPIWGKQIIDNLLSNEKYMGNDVYPQVITKELFEAVQQEKERRKNTAKDSPSKSRYSNAHPLSGLIFCGECGRKYRRYTRSNGAVVWRCANRIEHGSAICKDSPAIPEEELKAFLADILIQKGRLKNNEQFDVMVRTIVDRVIVQNNGQLQVKLQPEETHQKHIVRQKR